MRPYLFIISILLFPACKKLDFIERAGSNTEKIIKLNRFTKVNISAQADLVLIQDTICFAHIKGKSKVIDEFHFDTNSNTVVIEQKCTRFIKKGFYTTTIELHFSELDQIHSDGNTNIYSRDTLSVDKIEIQTKGKICEWNIKLKANELNVQLHAPQGIFTILGEVDKAYLYTIGTNHLKCKELETNHLDIYHCGIGDVHVSSKDYLHATIQNNGNIYCYTAPTEKDINYKKGGKGKVIYVN